MTTCSPSSDCSFGAMAFILPPKKRLRKNVSRMSSRWWPSAILVAPTSRRHPGDVLDRKSTRLNSSHLVISYAVFCLKKKNKHIVCASPLPSHCTVEGRSLTESERNDPSSQEA